MKRKCTGCGEEFPATAEYFHLRYDRKNRLHSVCKPCYRELQRKNHATLKQRLLDYKGGKCIICGYDKHNHNLTFHHLDPSKKEMKIGASSRSFEILKQEVDRCVVMCHLCHNDTHAGFYPQYLVVK